LDRVFEDAGLPTFFSEERRFTPAFDVSETDKELILRAEVPGMDKDDIDINLTDGLLSIRGEKKREHKEENENYYCIERHYGTFSRTMRLPVEVETDKIDATYKDGVLTIILPKTELVEPKKIQVH
jgi:HSP20 family protein